MNCHELESLHLYLDDELLPDEQLEVESHLAGCETCSRRYQVERHNLAVIRQALQASPPAPQALRARVSAGLARLDRQRHTQRTVVVVAAAAACVAAVVAADARYRAHRAERWVASAVERHVRQHPLEVGARLPQELERWFQDKLPHRVSVPRLKSAIPEGGRLSHVNEREAGYVRYAAMPPDAGLPHRVGLLVVADRFREFDIQGQVASAADGYNVVSWRDGDLVYQLVSDLDPGSLRFLLQPGEDAQPLPASFTRSESPLLPGSELDVQAAALTR
jgi:anti-sigma factor RsiW